MTLPDEGRSGTKPKEILISVEGEFFRIGKTPNDYFSMIKSSFPILKEWIESGSYREYMQRRQILPFKIITDGIVP